MQVRALVLDHLWTKLGAAARARDGAEVERLWILIDGFERLSEAQAERLFQLLGQDVSAVPRCSGRPRRRGWEKRRR
jgi:hypothetical protein